MAEETDPLQLPDLAAVRAARARIHDRIAPSPLLPAHDLSELLGQPLSLKAESLQPTGSFKVRGALNWVRRASSAQLTAGLATVSAGNHAMALAWAAAQVGAPVQVLMPAGSSELKVRVTRRLGAEVSVGGDIGEAVAACHRLCREQGRTLVHPYDDPWVMAGQGTLGLELLEQAPELRRVLCPVGGGGLISGLGVVLKALRPEVELIGVEPEGAAALAHAWRHGDCRAALERVTTVAPSLAPAVVGRHTYAASRRVVDRLVTVSDAAILQALELMLTLGRLYAEPGAVVGLAALLEGAVEVRGDQLTALIVTGGNMGLDELQMLIGRT